MEKKNQNFKEYIKKIRNIGVMAHIDAGKTTTTERILYHAGKIHKIGEVHDGQAQMDWMEQEQERGITITSAATTVSWKGCTINVIDTPGHVDFTAEVERSLRVLDGAVSVIDAQSGVEPQTETVWRQADKYSVPRIVFVNKMDKIGANFLFSLKTLKNKLGANAKAIQLPIGQDNSFNGIIDLVTFKAYEYLDGINEEVKEIEIPNDLKETAKNLRQELIDSVLQFEDQLMEKYILEEKISVEDLKTAIRKATITSKFFPVLAGSAFKHKGIKFLLNAVIDYLPSPLDLPAIKVMDIEDESKLSTRKCLDTEPFTALAFKVITDPYVGKLIFFRVYSGTLESGSYLLNASKNKKERVSRLLKMHANNRSEIKVVKAGDIIAGVGFKSTVTGDTLTSVKEPILLESINFPEPVISLSLTPKSKKDQEKLSFSLAKLTEEDPTFKTWMDYETQEIIISGMGELHLEILIDRLKREFGVDVKVGTPKVAYRETITKPVDVEGKYIRQSGGRGQYGHVKVKYFPNKPGKGFKFINSIVSGRIPREYIPHIKKSIIESMTNGVLAGYPTIDLIAELYDGSFHEVDSSELSFKIAAAYSFKKLKDASPILLEPIMKIEVVVPANYLGDVMGDLSSRRGIIEEHYSTNEDNDNSPVVVKAKVPLSNMFGYSTVLRSFSQGRGNYTMEFLHYEKVPNQLVEKIIKKN